MRSNFQVGHQAFIVDHRAEPLLVRWRALLHTGETSRRGGRGGSSHNDFGIWCNSDAADNFI
jgi:hypothetical protein